MAKASDSQRSTLLIYWSSSVSCTLVPFLCFLGLLELYTAGGLAVAEQHLIAGAGFQAGFVKSATAQAFSLMELEVQLIHYSGLLLLHGLLSVAILIYFGVLYRVELVYFTDSRRRCSSFLVLFILIVYATLVYVTYSNNSFSRMALGFPTTLLEITGMSAQLSPVVGDVYQFLRMALLMPVMIAVPAIVMASAAFHLQVIRPTVLKRENIELIHNGFQSLKRGVVILSVLLVSAVVTAGNFFQLIPDSLGADDTGFVQVYAGLAEALTLSSGMLFTATLIFAFLPGCVILLWRVNELKDSSQDKTTIDQKLKDIGLGASVLQIAEVVMAVIAPAVTSPIIGVFKSMLSVT